MSNQTAMQQLKDFCEYRLTKATNESKSAWNMILAKIKDDDLIEMEKKRIIMKNMTAVEWIIEEINQQQKNYIDLAKKDKSLKNGVHAILTATTILKMKCEQAKEIEEQQMFNFAIWYSGMEEIKVHKAYERYLIETFNK